MEYLLVIVIGYLLGCINGSNIIGSLKKVDIKGSGTKNAGASNTTLLLGWKYGLVVLVIDVLKAVIPILVLKSMTDNYALIYLLGAFVIVGHNYPFNMKFNGGKGTASVIGMFFAIDWHVGLGGLGLLIVFSIATDYLVVGVLAYYGAFIYSTLLLGYGLIPTLITLALTAISMLKHRENYDRIKLQTETRISSVLFKKIRMKV